MIAIALMAGVAIGISCIGPLLMLLLLQIPAFDRWIYGDECGDDTPSARVSTK